IICAAVAATDVFQFNNFRSGFQYFPIFVQFIQRRIGSKEKIEFKIVNERPSSSYGISRFYGLCSSIQSESKFITGIIISLVIVIKKVFNIPNSGCQIFLKL